MERLIFSATDVRLSVCLRDTSRRATRSPDHPTTRRRPDFLRRHVPGRRTFNQLIPFSSSNAYTFTFSGSLIELGQAFIYERGGSRGEKRREERRRRRQNVFLRTRRTHPADVRSSRDIVSSVPSSCDKSLDQHMTFSVHQASNNLSNN